MQITYISKINILLIFCIVMLLIANCSNKLLSNVIAQKNVDNISNNKKEENSNIDFDELSPKYDIVGKNCVEAESCYLFVYIEEKYFNKKDLSNLAKVLKSFNKERKFLQIAFFDNAKVPEQYIAGKRNWGELGRDTRAVYSYDKEGKYSGKCESLKIRFSKNKDKPMKTIFQKSECK